MFMNSLCALMLGFVLDLALGDPNGKIYPITLIKNMVASLEVSLKKAYADSSEAQSMAGIMLITLTLVIVLGISLALLILCYSVSPVLGIIMEGLLCWMSMSIKLLRVSVQGVYRCGKYGNIGAARRSLKRITTRDTDGMDMDDAMKCAVETASENTVCWGVSPILWIMVFGGLGGMFCRCVNIIRNSAGCRIEEGKGFGKYPSKLDGIVNYIPARIAAGFMKLNVSFFCLDEQGAQVIYRRDRNKTANTNAGQTQAVCAGALGIEIGSDEYYGGILVKNAPIGIFTRPIEPTDVYWSTHLMSGTAAYAMTFACLLKIALYVVFAVLL